MGMSITLVEFKGRLIGSKVRGLLVYKISYPRGFQDY